MTIAHAVDGASIFGPIVAALRQGQGASRAALAGRLPWDRRLLGRIEAGRNTANIDNIFVLEQVFQVGGLMTSHGDLVELTHIAVREAKRWVPRPIVGRVEKQEEHASVEAATLDRIVARVVDGWLVALRGEPVPEVCPSKPRR